MTRRTCTRTDAVETSTTALAEQTRKQHRGCVRAVIPAISRLPSLHPGTSIVRQQLQPLPQATQGHRQQYGPPYQCSKADTKAVRNNSRSTHTCTPQNTVPQNTQALPRRIPVLNSPMRLPGMGGGTVPIPHGDRRSKYPSFVCATRRRPWDQPVRASASSYRTPHASVRFGTSMPPSAPYTPIAVRRAGPHASALGTARRGHQSYSAATPKR